MKFNVGDIVRFKAEYLGTLSEFENMFRIVAIRNNNYSFFGMVDISVPTDKADKWLEKVDMQAYPMGLTKKDRDYLHRMCGVNSAKELFGIEFLLNAFKYVHSTKMGADGKLISARKAKSFLGDMMLLNLCEHYRDLRADRLNYKSRISLVDGTDSYIHFCGYDGINEDVKSL